MKKLLPGQYARILFEITDGKTGKTLEAAVRTYADFLKRRRAVSRLPAIITAFFAWSDRASGKKQLSVVSARTISKESHALIEKKFGGEITTSDIDTEKIGGFIVRDGDTVYDGSIRNQLERLKLEIRN
ncbi:MAG: F0F1 ATP synthase subunit delta [Patescibacteria group bacterium]